MPRKKKLYVVGYDSEYGSIAVRSLGYKAWGGAFSITAATREQRNHQKAHGDKLTIYKLVPVRLK